MSFIYSPRTVNEKWGSIPATAEQIKNRFEVEGFDPQEVRYAYIDDKPVAYIQTRKTSTQTIISYPWALPETPFEVQDKLFTEMRSYLQNRDPETQIISSTIQGHWTEVLEWAKIKNLKVANEFESFEIDIENIRQVSVPLSSFDIRKATEADIEALIELGNSDPDIAGAFDDKALHNYLKNNLSSLDNFLVFKDSNLVAAGAVQKGQNNTRVNSQQYTITRPGHIDAWKALIITLNQYARDQRWTDKPLTYFDRLPEQVDFLKEIGGISKIGKNFEVYSPKSTE